MKDVFYCVRNKLGINPFLDEFQNDEINGDVIIVAVKDLHKEEITIPETIEGYEVKEIGEDAFIQGAVKVINLPSTIISVGDNAFPKGVKINFLGEEYDENNIYFAVKRNFQEVLNDQVDGVIEAVYQQEKIIEIVKKCRSMEEVVNKLKEGLGLNELQIKTVLCIPLSTLSQLDVNQLEMLKVDYNN